MVITAVVGIGMMAKSCEDEFVATKAAREDCAAKCSPMAPDLFGTAGHFTCYCDARKVKP